MKAHADYTDDELVVLLNEGDQKAFEIIYYRYSPELYQWIRTLVMSKQDCEEILQNVFERLWRNHKTVHIHVKLRSYLSTKVKFAMLDYFQERTRHKAYNEHFDVFEMVYDVVVAPEAEQVYNVAHTMELIESEIAKMPERVQMAFRLRLKENLSNVEIASRMAVSNKTVENYMHTVYAHFRKYSPLLKVNT
ncbi:MAG TPA: sigma-70 family RNA polymerase sigma factor [Cyclobacteriaceae bacterium]|nr:sigma-70 family RNA polymerase sigma factor [Cyclobacteriaceae bacterium]HRF32987.1 sigma-70 family RNA polymerase sigma factor [Cyclobacteriaceae bacterium]